MDAKGTKEERDKTCCSGFKDAPPDFEKMAEMMSRCCGSQDGSMDCSAMGKKIINAMMEMCCGPKADKAEQGYGNDKI